MTNIKSILVDNSFCTRLFKTNDEYHQNVLEYFQYFVENRKDIILSTIVISEYAVADNPDNLLATENFKLLEFDYKDARMSGEMFKELKNHKDVIKKTSRNIVINDLKIIAQIHNRNIDAYISKDVASLKTMIEPLRKIMPLSFEFIDLSIPLNKKLGKLF